MTYTPTPYSIARTAAGCFIAWSNGTDHIGFRTEQSFNLPPFGTDPDMPWSDIDASITVSRVAYRMQAHLRQVDGTWTADDWGTARQALRRAEMFSLDGPSNAAVKEYDARVLPALIAFAESDQGRQLIVAGEQAAAANAYDTAVALHDKARKEAEHAEREVQAAWRRRRDADKAAGITR